MLNKLLPVIILTCVVVSTTRIPKSGRSAKPLSPSFPSDQRDIPSFGSRRSTPYARSRPRYGGSFDNIESLRKSLERVDITTPESSSSSNTSSSFMDYSRSASMEDLTPTPLNLDTYSPTRSKFKTRRGNVDMRKGRRYLDFSGSPIFAGKGRISFD